jgi:hypothetical protein
MLNAEGIAKGEHVVVGVWLHAGIPCMHFNKRAQHMWHQGGMAYDGIPKFLQHP